MPHTASMCRMVERVLVGEEHWVRPRHAAQGSGAYRPLLQRAEGVSCPKREANPCGFAAGRFRYWVYYSIELI